MNITDVRVRKIESEGKTKAFVSVTFDNMFVVHDIRVIEGDAGLFIAMPSKRGAGGDRVEIVHPLTRDFRSVLQARILEEYDRS